MFLKKILSYLFLYKDQGIIDGQAVLYPEDDSYLSYRTRDIPEGEAPKVIIFKDKIYTDAEIYDSNGFRIYEENNRVYKHTSLSDDAFKVY